MIFYYIMIFLFPFENHPILSASIFGITTIKIAGIVATVVAVNKYLQGDNPIIATRRIVVPFLCFFMWYCLSFLVNDTTDGLIVFPRFLSVSMLLFTSAILLNDSRKIWNIMLLIAVSMDISSLYVVKQYLYGAVRPGGTFEDCNFYAIAGAFTAALCLALGVYQARFRMFLLGSSVLNIAGVLLSGSRGGFITLTVSLLYFWYKQKKRIVVALLLISFLGSLIVLVPNTTIERFEAGDYGSEQSTGHRLEILKAGWQIVKGNFIIGVGPGMFKPKTVEYFESAKMARMAHNSYLEIAAEFGILGFIIFIWLCYASVRELIVNMNVVKTQNLEMKATLQAILVAISGYFVGAIFLSVEYEKVLWLTISIASVCATIIQRESIFIRFGRGMEIKKATYF